MINMVEKKSKRKMSWEEFWRGVGVDPPPIHPSSLKNKSKRHRKRFRPEKIISEREFLTGEHRTKDDLPTHLEILDPKKRKKTEPKASKTNNKTRKYLGSGKKPRWMNCPKEEVYVDDEEKEKEETENSS